MKFTIVERKIKIEDELRQYALRKVEKLDAPEGKEGEDGEAPAPAKRRRVRRNEAPKAEEAPAADAPKAEEAPAEEAPKAE